MAQSPIDILTKEVMVNDELNITFFNEHSVAKQDYQIKNTGYTG